MMTYQLSDILQIVAKSFKEIFFEFQFWFEAEVSRVNIVNNNLYFDLVEFDNTG